MQQENHFKRMFNKEIDHFYPENTEKQAVYTGRFSLTTIGPCVPVHVIVFSFLRSYFIFHEMEKSTPVNAAMHSPHSLVRVGPGCAGRA